ncbi:hypothetical protein ACEQ8H_001184 [Pleosporales sp. CAS-2024a]
MSFNLFCKTAASSASPSTSSARNGPKNRTLILDLGHVMFHYSVNHLALPRSTFQSILLSPTWSDLERGQLSEHEAIQAIGKELSLDPVAIKEALTQARQTLRAHHQLYDQLVHLKKEMNGSLKIYAMTNIARDDFARLKAVLPDWRLFDREFTSFEAAMAKPELGYYQHVLEQAGIDDCQSVVFVDDKICNVTAARFFGLRGIVFESADSLMRQLRNEFLDPVMRGRKFMTANARNHLSQIEHGPVFRDVFSQFLIQRELHDTSFISLSRDGASEEEIGQHLKQAKQEAKQWNYFIGPPVGTTKTFPADVDDTAMGLLALSPPRSSANAVLDSFLANRSARDGLVQVYFDEKRPRTCHVVLVNVIRVFYHYGRNDDVQNELAYVGRILANRAYLDAPEYIGPEPFLYFLSCLVKDNAQRPEIQSLREMVAVGLREQVGRGGDAFKLACRVLACQALGVWTGLDVSDLKGLQQCDGGWEIGWVCRFGRTQRRIGNRGVATAFAIKALEQDIKAL